MNAYYSIHALIIVNIVVFILVARSWLIGRKIMKQHEQKYRLYRADMEATGKRFSPDAAVPIQDTTP